MFTMTIKELPDETAVQTLERIRDAHTPALYDAIMSIVKATGLADRKDACICQFTSVGLSVSVELNPGDMCGFYGHDFAKNGEPPLVKINFALTTNTQLDTGGNVYSLGQWVYPFKDGDLDAMRGILEVFVSQVKESEG